jgi:hypothetical protein
LMLPWCPRTERGVRRPAHQRGSPWMMDDNARRRSTSKTFVRTGACALWPGVAEVTKFAQTRGQHLANLEDDNTEQRGNRLVGDVGNCPSPCSPE